MVDIENEVFSYVADEIRKEIPSCYVTGVSIRDAPQSPAVSIMEMFNAPYRYTRTIGGKTAHDTLMYQFEVYSNKTTGKQAECKKIIKIIDEAMEAIGFVRVNAQPIEVEKANEYRMLSRYRAVTDGNKIYRIL